MMTQSKGIYLLPNILTTAALLAGFFSIITATRAVYEGERLFETAAIAILVSGLFDGLDGRVARLTNTQSEFGAQYDSLSDVVAFGVAPAVLVFSWSLSALGKLGWVAAFIYVAGTALRLARFNIHRFAKAPSCSLGFKRGTRTCRWLCGNTASTNVWRSSTVQCCR